jgi:Na+/melibiose symporter-like transporter
MEIDPQLFRPVFIGVGLITMGASIPLMRLPTEKLTSTQSVSPIKSFSILFEDPYFGYFCLIWVIFGLAILSILTMQVLYLAEEDRGLGLSSLQVLLITGVLSGIVKVVANQPMSKLFSRVDIFRFRFIINLVMAAGTFMFFQMDNFWLLMVANIILNIGITGDYLMWGIFVTRVAPRIRPMSICLSIPFSPEHGGLWVPVWPFFLFRNIPYSSLVL